MRLFSCLLVFILAFSFSMLANPPDYLDKDTDTEMVSEFTLDAPVIRYAPNIQMYENRVSVDYLDRKPNISYVQTISIERKVTSRNRLRIRNDTE